MSAFNPMVTGGYVPNAAEAAKKIKIKDDKDLASEQKEMFLKLMIAQLKNQDPTSPMDQKDMMASITQMSQVEQFMNMSKAMESLALSQGVGMVGKNVEFTSVVRGADGQIIRNETLVGVVDHIIQKDGVVKLVVNTMGVVKPDGSMVPVPPGTSTISAGDVTRIG